MVCAKEVYWNSFWEANQWCVERSENTVTSLSLSLFCFSLFQPQVAHSLHTTHHLFLSALVSSYMRHTCGGCAWWSQWLFAQLVWVVWRVKQFTQAALLLTLLFHADLPTGQSPNIDLAHWKFRVVIRSLGCKWSYFHLSCCYLYKCKQLIYVSQVKNVESGKAVKVILVLLLKIPLIGL